MASKSHVAKVYADKVVADAICKSLSQGKKGAHTVIECEGGFKVVAESELEALTAPESHEVTDAATTILSAEQSDEAKAVAATIAKAKADEIVTVEIAGAKITKDYVITPTLGKRPRWFEKKRLVSYEKTAKGVAITAPAKVFISRGLKEMLPG